MTQQVERQLIEPSVLMQVCQTMMQNGEAGPALELMRMGFERMTDTQRPDIGHNLGVMLLNQSHPRQAAIYFREIVLIEPARYSSFLHLAFAELQCGNNNRALEYFLQSNWLKPTQPTSSDQLLDNAIKTFFRI